MASRRGATLVEVLVAIFVMGIGMIALLTLFPLGALRMAQAIQDDRCATAVINANAIATMKDIRNDASVRTPLWFSAPPFPAQPFDVFTDAISSPAAFNYGRQFPADPQGPSYPVYIDPIGSLNSVLGSTAQPSQYWLGASGGSYNSPAGKIARTSISFVANAGTPSTAAFKWFALLDDLNFDNAPTTGGVAPPAGGVLQRDIRYSWAYLVQRPRSCDSSIITCSVVVYNKRPLSLTKNLALAEATYNATFNTTKNTITIDWTNAQVPNIRPGDWVLDSTYIPPANQKAPQYGTAHGYFYRVVGITDLTTTSAELDVQQPLRGFPIPTLTAPASTQGQIMILEGIAEVYERGVDRKFD